MPRLHRYFFNRPSFLEGVARAVDVSGGLTVHLECPDAATADWLSMADDYLAVKEDIDEGIRVFRVEFPDDVVDVLPPCSAELAHH